MRVALTLEAGLLDWMRGHSEPGGLFRNDTHAVEAACKRLQDEQTFVQQQCMAHSVEYNPVAFWNLYGDLRSQFSPNRPGRVWHPESRTKRALIWFAINAALQKWMDKQCSEGAFENASHLIETGLRNLRRAEPVSPSVAFTGFPFDGQQAWANYRKELAALAKDGKPSR